MKSYWYHPESEAYCEVEGEDEARNCAEQGCCEVSFAQYVKATYTKAIPAIIDYETFWGPGYTLSDKKMTTEAYIRDERFHAHGAGIQLGNSKPVWVPHGLLPIVFKKLPWDSMAFIGHHLNFDGAITSWRYGYKPRRWIDTLALSRCILGVNVVKHGLDAIAPILTGLTKYPGFLKETYGLRTLTPQIEARLAHYCVGPISECGRYAGDIVLTREVLRKLLPHMPKDELDALHWSIDIFTDPQVYFDYDMLVKYNEEVKEKKAAAMASVDEMIEEYMENHKVKVAKGKDAKKTVIRSNPHYAALLTLLGVDPPLKINKDGKETYAFAKTDEGHKELLEHPDERVQVAVAARLEVKSSIEETRSQSYLEVAPRGAWPIHLNMGGAHTIRFSGGKGAGGNPQNLKRGGTLRDAILAATGKIFFVSDLSQIEARITLWIGMHMPNAKLEAEALEIMRTGGDIYAFFGSYIYGMEITKKTHPFERQVAKSAVLGLGFGMGAKRFIEYCKTQGVMNMTLEEAERIKNIYRSMFPGVVESWKYMQNGILPALMDLAVGVNFPSDEHPLCYTSVGPIFGEPCITLPGGLQLRYPQIHRDEDGQWKYMHGPKWSKTFGGSMLENVVQAVAGRMLREHIIKIRKLVPVEKIRTVTNTHDELLNMIDDRPLLRAYRDEVSAKLLEISLGATGIKLPSPPETPESRVVTHIMTQVPAYLPGLPIGVEYDYGYRYGDAK